MVGGRLRWRGFASWCAGALAASLRSSISSGRSIGSRGLECWRFALRRWVRFARHDII